MPANIHSLLYIIYKYTQDQRQIVIVVDILSLNYDYCVHKCLESAPAIVGFANNYIIIITLALHNINLSVPRYVGTLTNLSVPRLCTV